MSTGIMICGALGCSGSTLIYGYNAGKTRKDVFKQGSMWSAVSGDFLHETYNLVFSGWDLHTRTLSESVKKYGILPFSEDVEIDLFSPVVGPLDYAHRVLGIEVSHSSLETAIQKIENDIRVFKTKNALQKVIVLNFSSPMYCGKEKLKGWDSITAYSRGSVAAGADWIEFTPSSSITEELQLLAIKNKSRLAGRDGSTGQTILKLLFRDFLLNRGFSIDGWYSANIIGNNDGRVLAHPDYNGEKIIDKMSVLNNAISDNDNHIVEIAYYKPAGDNKESWDCVSFSGWLDSKMSLRINWHGRDSLLAAALALDIITGLIKAEKTCRPYGIVDELSICFKNPIHSKAPSYFEQFRIFRDYILS